MKDHSQLASKVFNNTVMTYSHLSKETRLEVKAFNQRDLVEELNYRQNNLSLQLLQTCNETAIVA